MTGTPEEITEFAVSYTNVGGIDISINLPGYLAVRHLLFTQLVSHIHQIGSGRVVIQVNTFFNTQKLKPRSAL
jgi:hypothetical protein